MRELLALVVEEAGLVDGYAWGAAIAFIASIVATTSALALCSDCFGSGKAKSRRENLEPFEQIYMHTGHTMVDTGYMHGNFYADPMHSNDTHGYGAGNSNFPPGGGPGNNFPPTHPGGLKHNPYEANFTMDPHFQMQGEGKHTLDSSGIEGAGQVYGVDPAYQRSQGMPQKDRAGNFGPSEVDMYKERDVYQHGPAHGMEHIEDPMKGIYSGETPSKQRQYNAGPSLGLANNDKPSHISGRKDTMDPRIEFRLDRSQDSEPDTWSGHREQWTQPQSPPKQPSKDMRQDAKPWIDGPEGRPQDFPLHEKLPPREDHSNRDVPQHDKYSSGTPSMNAQGSHEHEKYMSGNLYGYAMRGPHHQKPIYGGAYQRQDVAHEELSEERTYGMDEDDLYADKHAHAKISGGSSSPGRPNMITDPYEEIRPAMMDEDPVKVESGWVHQPSPGTAFNDRPEPSSDHHLSNPSHRVLLPLKSYIPHRVTAMPM